MLARLAFANVRRSARDYAIYFVTLVLGVAVFYAFNTVSMQASFLDTSVSDALRAMGRMLRDITVFLAVIMGFLMVYANGYLMRRRSRELGLYQVLGMRRSQVLGIVTIELLVTSLVSCAVGLLVGGLLSQVLLFITARLFHEAVQGFHFFVSARAVTLTLSCFALIFAVMLALNALRVGKLSLTVLMGSSRANEKVRVRGAVPSILLFTIGVALVGLAYFRLMRDGYPLGIETSERLAFLVTTGIVVAGTFASIFGLGGIYLVISQVRTDHYWRDLNMFTARQVASRVNTACATLSVIALVLFLAITSVSAGMGICEALTAEAEENSIYDASFTVFTAAASDSVEDLAGQAGVDLDSLGTWVVVDTYSGLGKEGALTAGHIIEQTGISLPVGAEHADMNTIGLPVMGASDFNDQRVLLGLDPVDLGRDSYLITCQMGSITDFYNAGIQGGCTFELADVTLHALQDACVEDDSAKLRTTAMGDNAGTLVVPDEALAAAVADCPEALRFSYLNVMYPNGASTEIHDQLARGAAERLGTYLEDLDEGSGVAWETRTSSVKGSFGTRGLISYLAVYIGFVLVVSCAAILAIQQLTSAIDAAPRFRTLSQLGCPESLCYGSLRTQTLASFLVPLVVALAHSVIAVWKIMDFVKLFVVADISSGIMVTGAIFLTVYGVYLLVTYMMSRGIVRESMRLTRRVG